jgi:hypothetical protein
MKAKLVGRGKQSSVLVEMEHDVATVIFGRDELIRCSPGDEMQIPVNITMGPSFQKRIENFQQTFEELRSQ